VRVRVEMIGGRASSRRVAIEASMTSFQKLPDWNLARVRASLRIDEH